MGTLGIRKKEESKWVLGCAQVKEEGSHVRRIEVGKENAVSERKE